MLKLDYSVQVRKHASYITLLLFAAVTILSQKFAILQEKIVKALCLKTSSSELDGYCLMWDLRPYVDDNVMQLAWKFIS
jgi:hypothetical protein